MKKKPFWWIVFLLLIIPVLCVGLYQLPFVYEPVAWRLANLRTEIHYFFNPPDQVIFSPQDSSTLTPLAFLPTLIPATAMPTATIPLDQPSLPSVTATSTPIPAILPTQAVITGVPHEYQSFNNCGPANLSMVMGFWGWQGDQRDVRTALRSNENDSNVMPDEMVDFVSRHSQLKAVVRRGGSLTQIKQFIAAGFPVLIESGHQPADDWWMGHYVTISGYDDVRALFITQDSLIMPDLPLPYAELENNGWRDFNHLYLIVYPQEKYEMVLWLLNQDADEQQNITNSLSKTQGELNTLAGRAYFFRLYNQGADQVFLGQFTEAAESFDLAFKFYSTLNEHDRPWRVLWYRVEPYEAYYQVGRYRAVIDLADATLSMLSKHGLEESHYWRGMAYEALGNREKALSDYQIAVELRPDYALALTAIDRLQ